MSHATALRIAIDLMLVPSRVRIVKGESLPEGVSFLLRIAAGDADATLEAASSTGKSPETLQAASTFFIEQILLASGSDSYRILGARQSASAAELRSNLALLLRWLHADNVQNSERSIFVRRLTDAWNDLKTPQRRAAYDVTRKMREAERSTRGDRPAGTSAGHHREETQSGKKASFRVRRKPSQAIGFYAHERTNPLRRAFLFLFGRG
jgi:hypothetical protein